ncbi:MAG: hypothetical protein LQ343_006797 [Gyalolechia ehrenbergii]|nr:MAG: hypothetical protein LQ343_006797 [Gyalolechia ehrenbergii]
MPSVSSSTGLTITNPLVLYRSLLATKRIDPDPAQHRLALHLQKLYHRLKDYEPAVDYRHRLNRLVDAVAKPNFTTYPSQDHPKAAEDARRKGIFSSFLEQKGHAEALALTRRLTDHESAVQLQSPQGLLLYGEVGTGKSMLIDLLSDCLPNRKKRRWHFNTFMLETFAKLEQLRRIRLATLAGHDEEHSLLWLARDMISTSPILFLDEFQLPDRTASKILSTLLTSFFHLGGVLVATSNRMPEELANASGVEFAAPPTSRLGLLRNRWGLLGSGSRGARSESVSPGGDSAAFLEVLRARCEIWDMESGKDWRRREVEKAGSAVSVHRVDNGKEQGFHGLQPMAPGNWGLGYEQSIATQPQEQAIGKKASDDLPRYFFVDPSGKNADYSWASAVLAAVATSHTAASDIAKIPWQSTSFRIYGRKLHVPRQFSGVSYWTFDDLCVASLGPADYITLASNFHTFILVNVPILTLIHKNEARRLITLLDALYEARCRLLLCGAAGPDDIFFPETQHSPSINRGISNDSDVSNDGVYPETFSEIYQDQTSPFRPNVSAYTSSASPPSYDSSLLPSSSLNHSNSSRSILADEDSDFDLAHGAGRSSGSRYRGFSDGTPGAGNEIGQQSSPDFGRSGIFTGEDEKFAFKRARSRLWEMCGARWWAREEPWWQPLSKEVRRWENSAITGAVKQLDGKVNTETTKEEAFFRHGASPFRTSLEPPPKISWTHAWGMMKWGKRAGAWGRGPQGVEERHKLKPDSEDKSKDNTS